MKSHIHTHIWVDSIEDLYHKEVQMPEVITMKQRFEYYKNLYEETYGVKITYPQFIEAIFSKLEQEIRSKISMLDIYVKNDHKTINQEDFTYDYDM